MLFKFLEKYKFTEKRHSHKGIMSTNLGLIGIVTTVACVWLGFLRRGEVPYSYGAALFLAELMSMVGLGLGLAGRFDIDRYYFFPNLGIFLNGLVLAGGIVLLGLGLA